ncbi:MAG: hypothetical protein ACK4E8_04515 [Lacibacter sp.]
MLATAQEKTAWPAMQEFHAVMSKTYHAAEKNDFAPLKAHANHLLMAAKAWQQSPVPKGYDAGVTAPLLKKLVQQCTVVQKAVQDKKPDAVLLKEITRAHDIFHEITERCTEEAHR